MYRFRFEQLLVQRKNVEELLQKELGENLRVLQDEKQQLSETIQRKDSIQKDLENKKKTLSDLEEIRLYVQYLTQLSSTIERQEKSVAVAEKIFEQKQQEMIEAVKNRKKLEKLEDTELKNWIRQGILAERKSMDEAAINSFNRKL